MEEKAPHWACHFALFQAHVAEATSWLKVSSNRSCVASPVKQRADWSLKSFKCVPMNALSDIHRAQSSPWKPDKTYIYTQAKRKEEDKLIQFARRRLTRLWRLLFKRVITHLNLFWFKNFGHFIPMSVTTRTKKDESSKKNKKKAVETEWKRRQNRVII